MTCHMKEKDHWFHENSSEDWGWEIKKQPWVARGFPSYHGTGTQMKVGLYVFFAQMKNADLSFVLWMWRKSHFFPTQASKNLCPSCHKSFEHEPGKAYRDSRNVAYILHRDGFQPFSGKENHGCGALEVQIATMCKEDRCKTGEVFVVGFVSCYLLPNKRPVALDPFLAPFIEEM